MAVEQNMTQAFTQAVIETAKAVIMTVREADNPLNTAKCVQVMLNQQTFDWKVAGIYQEL